MDTNQTSSAPSGDYALLSIVVPVFNEEEGIEEFHKRTTSLLDSLSELRGEVIYVDDGSSDNTYDILLGLAGADSRVKLVKLSRNFGHQVAITAGIDVALGDAVVVIDSDLQDPPEVIKDFIRKWREGYDVVYGVREKRAGETRFKILTAKLFYRILKSVSKTDIPEDVGDFRLMSKRATEHFRTLRERDRYVRGMVSWLGFKQVGVNYRRDERYAGITKYPLAKMIKFAFDGVTSFSSAPLKLATWLGYLASLLAFLYLCVVMIQKFMGYTVQGWATIMVGLLFFAGVQLICLGIVGEYIGRIFTEIKSRPLYIVEDIYCSKEESAAQAADSVQRPDRVHG